jgi:phage baseplate assembly protein W|tara:strand:- start:4150 stop:4560 length:411 start_codon:yes stop_codon:yes gene_type:complete
MAFEAKKINVLDLQPRKAVGVSLPFSNKAVFNSTYETKEAIKANLINYILTGKGERYFNPTFGSGIRNLLFSNINRDTLTDLEFLVRDALQQYFPRLEIIKLDLKGAPDSNMISFTLNFKLTDTQVEDEITINFEQ